MGNDALDKRDAEWEAQRAAEADKVFGAAYVMQLRDPKAELLEWTTARAGLAITPRQRAYWFTLDLVEKHAVIAHLLHAEEAKQRDARVVAKGYQGALTALAEALGLEVTAARREGWQEMSQPQLHALVAYVGEHRAFPADG